MKSICAQCGADLPDDSPGDRCPKCLLEIGLETVVGESQPPADTSPLSVKQFGDYELLEEIARGGMGVVYKARQANLNRIVALKLILSGQFASKQEVLRFRGEAEAAANLHHPNIVAIYETGEQEGQHYFSMEYVQGRDLAQIVRDGPLAAQRAARYVQVIAQAIHHAHQQGTLHRDLKPSNVLIDAADQPRITDFGLAKRLRGDFGLTVTGQVMGSPGFMPPEQTSGKRSDVGPASDVYGLGAILYHLLTGRPPFQAATIAEVLQQLREQEPVSPRLLNASVPRDLETICLKCLEKEPLKRYASAQELADELGRFLRDEPILARPASRPEKMWRWCRRKPALATALTSVGALAASLLVVGFLAGWRIRQGAAVLRENLYAADISLAAHALGERNFKHAFELVQRHVESKGQTDVRGFEWRYLWKRCLGDETASITAHDGAVSAVAFSPDGEWMVTGGQDCSVKLWNGHTRQFQSLLRPPVEKAHTWNGGVKFSGDGKLLALYEPSGISIVETSGWTETRKLPHLAAPIAFLKSGALIGRCLDGIRVWASQTWEPRVLFPTNAQFFAVAPDERQIAVVHGTTIDLLEFQSGRTAATLESALPSSSTAYSLVYSPDGRFLACGGHGEVWIWDAIKHSMITNFTAPKMFVIGLVFSNDSQHLAVGASDQYLTVWNTADWRLGPELLGYRNGIWALTFTPDGKELVSGSWDGTVKFWNLAASTAGESGARALKAQAPIGFSPDGRTIITLDMDTTLSQWDAATLRPKSSVKLHDNRIASAGAVSADGALAAVGYDDGLVELRELAGGGLKHVFRGLTNDLFAVDLSIDGKVVVAHESGLLASPLGRVRIWDSATGNVHPLNEKIGSEASAIAFSHGGDLVALAQAQGAVTVWDIARRQQVHALGARRGEVPRMAFSPDDRILATADSTVHLWDLKTDRELDPLEGQMIAVVGVAFSPDGKTIATGGMDKTVTLWQTMTARPLMTFQWEGGFLGQIFFSPDGNTIAAGILLHGGKGGGVKIWQAPSFAAIEARTSVTPATAR